jgi:hypothetical protein
MTIRLAMLAAAALAAAPLAAIAQPTKGQLTYRCTSKDGKKYYGSTIPPQCYGRVIEQLNAQGTVVKRIDPDGDEKERLAKEAEAAKKREIEAAGKESSRRNRALLATYTSERDIEGARGRALADNKRATVEVEMRIEALKKRRAGYDKELEFYKDKSKLPAKLQEDVRNAEIDLEAQEGLLAAKKRESESINARYDEDKKRYAELTRRGPR